MLLRGPADAQKFALGHWGDAGPFWHSEDISRGLNSGPDLYNGLAKIFKRGCFYVRGRLAHLLVGFFLRTASSWGERLVLL
ncbi:hypothetical protein RRG08_029591 [Elysia crispata]|uniref:Uncharacterized protein n=1 Tax=Elysia crispata TaxID=231223 RepID=A0AAE1CJY9_9GAST|nr:hypothetical protein RRG08_029591 [Elysia crispata]